MAPSMKKIWISNWVGPFMEFHKSDNFLLNFCNLIYNSCTYEILYVHSNFCLPDFCQEYFRKTF